MNEPSVDYLLDDVAASKFIDGSDGHCDRLRLLQVGVEMKMTLLVVLRQLLSADDRANDGAECVLGALEEVVQLRFRKGKSGGEPMVRLLRCCMPEEKSSNFRLAINLSSLLHKGTVFL